MPTIKKKKPYRKRGKLTPAWNSKAVDRKSPLFKDALRKLANEDRTDEE